MRPHGSWQPPGATLHMSPHLLYSIQLGSWRCLNKPALLLPVRLCHGRFLFLECSSPRWAWWLSPLLRSQLKHPLFSESPPFLTNGKLTAPSTALYHLKRLYFFLALTMIWSDLICFLCIVCLPHRNESCMVAGALSPAASTVPTTRLPGPPWKVVKVVHCTRALAEGLVVLISSLLSALHALGDPIGHPLLYSGACLWSGYGSLMGDQ